MGWKRRSGTPATRPVPSCSGGLSRTDGWFRRSDLPAGAALDLGAGEGRNAIWLARRGWRVTAVDFSRVALARAESLAFRVQESGWALDIEWVVADVRNYQPIPEQYDLVLLAYLHLPGEQRRQVIQRRWAGWLPRHLVGDRSRSHEPYRGIRRSAG